MVFDVFVGNLDFNVGEDQLAMVFSEVGKVIAVRMKVENGRPAPFAFVEFDDGDSMRAAVSLLDGRMVNQRPMKGDRNI